MSVFLMIQFRYTARMMHCAGSSSFDAFIPDLDARSVTLRVMHQLE